MVNKRKKKRWWHNIKFKYRLTIVNENTLEEVWGIYVSKLNGLSVLLCILLLLFTFASLLMVYTPLRNYLPGYMSNELRATIVDNVLRLDSLQSVADQQRQYVMNIQDLMWGRVNIDSVQSISDIDSLLEVSTDMLDPSEGEEAFRSQYEDTERYNLFNSPKNTTNTDGLEFYRPTRGILSSVFDIEKKHFGVDIAANPNESVLATLEGTVIWSAYSIEAGYVIALQHKKGIVSVYKHCGTLLKKEGQHVRAGEAIGLVGSSGVHSTGPHLHFELWNNGESLNPENYIVF
jgi:lipoprotein NlpD